MNLYRCCQIKKMGFLLLVDCMVIALWLLCARAVRALMPEPKKPEGIFLPVIMYHSVTSPINGDYQVTPEQLQTDLQYLQGHGYQTVSTAQLLAYTQGKEMLPAHPVLLTFDDGFYNNLSGVLPLLEQYDMCAVISIVGIYTDETAPRDPHVERYSYLTWEDVNTLLRSERIEIGSHTYNLHSNTDRAGCSIRYGEDVESYQAILRSDLQTLQNRMQQETGTLPTVFAYPYGFTCPESVPVLQELGFTCTFNCREAANYITRDTDCLYGLNRYNRSPYETTEDFFARALAEN